MRANRLQESSAVELLGTGGLPATVAALVGRLARGLEAFYGERYRGLVLYGSYARGEADEGSDVDLLLLLEGEVDPARELLRAEEVKWPLSGCGLHRLALAGQCGSLPAPQTTLPPERARGRSSPRLSEAQDLFDKAERSLAAAGRLLETGDEDFAVSRAYYGYFYIAEALLLSKGMSFSRHGQVLAQYGLHFAKTGILDRRFHQLFDEAFSLRQVADYSTDPAPDPGKVCEPIEEGKTFLREARGYTGGRSPRERS